jgi:AraC-like DNA-binding protein
MLFLPVENMRHIQVRSINAPAAAPDLAAGFAIRSIHDMLAGKDMMQPLHRHDFIYLLLLEKGSGKHMIDFTRYEVNDHTVFVMRAGQVHQLTLQAGSTGYLLQFTNGFFPFDANTRQLMRKAGNACLYQPDVHRFKKLYAAANAIFEEYTHQQDGYLEIIRASLIIFFVELTRQYTGGGNNAHLYTLQRLYELQELLTAHITTHKQVSDYANLMHLSAYQLNAITKSILGKTCSTLIDEHIILEAKRQLLATANQVNQVAAYLGYENVSYFIRFFKKHTGYSPEAFRNNFT